MAVFLEHSFQAVNAANKVFRPMASMHDRNLNTGSQTAPANAWGGGRLVGAAVVAGAVLLTLKYFPGLENEVAYAGNAFQIIHPDAFAGDPYRPPDASFAERPLQLSLMYVLVKIVGVLWLDDRFLAVIYAGLVAAGLWGIDRTARLLGVSGISERLIILLMFLKDHQILSNKVLLAHHPDVNHMAFAIPIIVWLFYAALARKGLVVVLLLSALLTAMSIPNAMFPILFSLAIVWVTGQRWERHSVTALVAVGLVLVYVGITEILPIPEDARLVLWDLIRIEQGAEANPFQIDGLQYLVGTIFWIGLCVGAYRLTPSGDSVSRGIRVMMLMAMATWMVSGLYITFAPDPLKAPLLLGFAPTRALAWPQNLAYVAILAGLFRWMDGDQETRSKVVSGGVIFLLFIAGPGNLGQWSLLLAISSIFVIAIFGIRQINVPSEPGFASRLAAAWPRIGIQALGVALLIAYGITLWGKAPAWAKTVRNGVWAENPAALWVDVADYIRTKTPTGSSVLPFYTDIGKTGAALHWTRSLGTRAGRAMPIPESYAPRFREPETWAFAARQREILEDIVVNLTTGDYDRASSGLEKLVPVPDYIVLPTTVVKPPIPPIPYVKDREIGAHTIWRRSGQRS